MRHTFPLLAALFALLLAVTPAGAHHGKGSHADGATSEEHGSKQAKSDKHGSKSESEEHDSERAKSDKHGSKSESEEHDSETEERGGFATCDWQADPDSCPG